MLHSESSLDVQDFNFECLTSITTMLNNDLPINAHKMAIQPYSQG